MCPGAITEDWGDYFHLAPFVATYAPDIAELEPVAVLLSDNDVTQLSSPDRVYLAALERSFDMYPEMRMGDGE